MIKKLVVTCLILTAAWKSQAQYYYKDIVSNKQLLDEMGILKDQGIRTVTITSLEDDGSPSENFLVEKKISRNYTSVETFTKSGVTGASIFTSTFTKEGSLIQTIDSSDLSVNTSSYYYDDQKRIKSIRSYIHSSDDDFKNELTEHHNYEYDANGKLARMYRIKNNTDTTLVLFSTDEHNNISIEKDTKTGKSYYYYYDTKNRLTDIVHLDPNTQRMLPDYIFEYNNAGQITKMTTTEEGSSYYYIWQYTYNNGLRVKEKCYSKERKLLGTINYEYK